MSKSPTYTHILIGLGLLFVLLLIGTISFKEGFVKKYETYTLLKTQTDLIDKAPEILSKQAQELKRIQGATKAYETGLENLNLNNAVDFGLYLENRCKAYGVRMISLPQEKEENLSGFKALEETFRLEGSLKNLLSLLYDLEQGQRVGSISKLVFKKENLRVFGKKEKVLTASISLKRMIEI